ncbi:MAG: hypothetical protein QRY72_00010 [Candidatus Rhabdochlamydia sp.]
MTDQMIDSSHPKSPYIQLQENNLVKIHGQSYRITHVKYHLKEEWKTLSKLSFTEREALTNNIHQAFEAFKQLQSYPPQLQQASVITLKFAHKIDPHSSGIRKGAKQGNVLQPIELTYRNFQTHQNESFLIQGNSDQEKRLLKQETDPLTLQLRRLKDKASSS